MRVQTRLIKGTALNLIAMSFNQGSTLIASILVARILKKQAFGEYAMVYTTLMTAAVLSQLATGYTASKYIAEHRSKDPVRAGRILGALEIVTILMAVIGAVILVLASQWIASTILKARSLALPLKLGSVFIFFSAMNGYQTGALAGLEAFRSTAKAGILSGIVAVLSVSLGAYWGGLSGAISGLGVGAFVRYMLHNGWLRLEAKKQGIRPQYRRLNEDWKIISGFALPAALAGYYSVPMIWIASSVLVRQPGGFSEMAVYSAANNIRILVLFLPNIMNVVGLSILNNEMAKGDQRHCFRIYRNNVLWISLVTLGGALLAGLLGPRILQLFGRGFSEGHVLLLYLLASCVLEGPSIALYQYLQSRAKIWLSLFFINIPREALFVILAFRFVPSRGGLGLAWAYLISAALGMMMHASLVLFLRGREQKEVGVLAATRR